MRLLLSLVLLSALPAALADDPGGCRELRGGRFLGLISMIVWTARVDCRASTIVWFETPAGKDGTAPGRRVDDLLIVSDLQKTHGLSLFSPLGVECRENSGAPSLVIGVGEWKSGARPGERQSVYRAWRVDAESGIVGELAAKDVTCALR